LQELAVANAIFELGTGKLYGLLELIIGLDIGLVPRRIEVIHKRVEGAREEIPIPDISSGIVQLTAIPWGSIELSNSIVHSID
jgi:hypothetical protein